MNCRFPKAVELNIENPAETLEHHPLMALAQNAIDGEFPGMGMRHARFSQCMLDCTERQKSTSWWTTSTELARFLINDDGHFILECKPLSKDGRRVGGVPRGCPNRWKHLKEWGDFPDDAA
eukprot:472212-Pleurochrysis_carterae.AAC.1